MTQYKLIQVYLTEQQHRALADRAKERGTSMANYLRQLVDEHVLSEQRIADLTVLSGTLKSGPPSDVGRDKRRMVAVAVEARHGLR